MLELYVCMITEDPGVLSQVMMKKAFRMLGINEDEDPTVVKDRILEQLTEEANKLGASITKSKYFVHI